jgi:hypothetical protein
MPSQCCHLKHVFVKDSWLAVDMEDLLWLPVDYRVSCIAIRDELVVLGHNSGLITFLELSCK